MNNMGVTNTQALTQPTSNFLDPGIFNPGIKATGAQVPFSPGDQQSMINMYGAPMQGSFDRMVSPMRPPSTVKTSITPKYNLSTL
jgi:hypothetical protein